MVCSITRATMTSSASSSASASASSSAPLVVSGNGNDIIPSVTESAYCCIWAYTHPCHGVAWYVCLGLHLCSRGRWYDVNEFSVKYHLTLMWLAVGYRENSWALWQLDKKWYKYMHDMSQNILASCCRNGAPGGCSIYCKSCGSTGTTASTSGSSAGSGWWYNSSSAWYGSSSNCTSKQIWSIYECNDTSANYS